MLRERRCQRFRARRMLESGCYDRIEFAQTPVIQPGNDALQLLDVMPNFIRRHLVNTDSIGRRKDEILTVAQLGDDRDLQTREESHQHAITLRTLPGPIGDNCQIAIAAVELRDEQQVGDKSRGRVDIDLRRHDRYQYAVSVVGLVVELVLRQRCRQVDDHVRRAGPRMQLRILAGLSAVLVSLDAVDFGPLG